MKSGHYRYDHIWVADDGELNELLAARASAPRRVVAAAIWWAFPAATQPMSLDGLWAVADLADPLEAWADLIRAGRTVNPGGDYHIFLPGGVRSGAAVEAELQPGLAAARAAGLTSTLERLRFEWLDSTPVPARSQRLAFRTEPDDEAFVDVFMRVADGSLDAT